MTVPPNSSPPEARSQPTIIPTRGDGDAPATTAAGDAEVRRARAARTCNSCGGPRREESLQRPRASAGRAAVRRDSVRNPLRRIFLISGGRQAERQSRAPRLASRPARARPEPASRPGSQIGEVRGVHAAEPRRARETAPHGAARRAHGAEIACAIGNLSSFRRRGPNRARRRPRFPRNGAAYAPAALYPARPTDAAAAGGCVLAP